MATIVIPKINTKDTQAFVKSASLADLITFQTQLEALNSTVHEHIEQRKAEDKDNIRAKLAELAKENGFDLAEFVNKTAKGKGSGEVKFRNPADATQTWSGRGRKPKWLLEMGDEAAAMIKPTSGSTDSGAHA